METTTLKFKKVVLPAATLKEMKPGMTLKIATEDIKTNILRMTASNLKKEGYLFLVSDKGLINETIVECLKTPEL
jgi:TusA-related sulfurtransferase